jgi:hypothetical protein
MIGINTLTLTALAERCLSRIEGQRALSLVDPTGEGLVRIGADARLCTGDYRVTQRWSRALWEHPQEPDGLYYRSRHDPSRFCIALCDRAAGAVRSIAGDSLLAPSGALLLADILGTYDFGLIDDRS